MYWTEPTLYGATLPQREFPVAAPYFTQWQNMPMPFYGQNLPVQAFPWQSSYRFMPPIYQGHPSIQPFFGQMPYMTNPYLPFGYGFQKPFTY